MPNRWIKEAYCASTRINAAGAEARDLWVRLLVNADDHGYFHGSAQLVASACYPLQPNARKCEQLLAELAKADLIQRYTVDGKAYLALNQWYERPRSKPKFPPPNGACEQLQTTANNREQLQASTYTSTTTITTTKEEGEVRPLIGFDDQQGWSGITAEDRDLWAKAYPAINVEQQLAAAAAWLRANPKNRKSNYPRFLTSWMARAQDKAPAARASRGPSAQADELRKWLNNAA